MRFRKIQIQQFRSHAETTIELEKLTFVRGGNASGKTSIEQALEITLAGHAEGTAADGKGSVNLIRAGQKKALVTLAVQNKDAAGNFIERTIKCALNDTKRTVLIEKPDDPQWSGGEKWKEWLEGNKDVMSCLVNNRYFVDLPSDKQADILASIILPKTYDWPEWVKPMANGLNLKINWALTPFEIIEQGYAAAYAERTGINREAKAFVMPTGDVAAADEYEEFQQRIATRRTELDAAKAKRTKMLAEVESHTNLRIQAETRLKEAETRMAREAIDITGYEEGILSKAKLKEHQTAAKSGQKATELDATIQRLNAEIELAKADIKKLDTMAEKCPTCGTEIDEAVMGRIAGPIIERRERLEDELKKAFDERKKLGDPQASIATLLGHERSLKSLENARKRVADDLAIAKDAAAKLEELGGSAAVDTSELDATIEDLTAKIAKGTEALNISRTARELKQRIATATTQKEKLQEKQKDVQKLVEYFETEVKAELLSSSVGSFTDSMNAVLAKWGYTCQLSIEPYVFAVVFLDGDHLPHPIALKFLSKSQRYRFAVAFQVALAIVTGFGFVVVDEADIFDSKGKAGLFQALNSGELEQAIVIGTDEREAVPSIEGAVFYMLTDLSQPGMIPTTTCRKLG